jgi:hypothetical protein
MGTSEFGNTKKSRTFGVSYCDRNFPVCGARCLPLMYMIRVTALHDCLPESGGAVSCCSLSPRVRRAPPNTCRTPRIRKPFLATRVILKDRPVLSSPSIHLHHRFVFVLVFGRGLIYHLYALRSYLEFSIEDVFWDVEQCNLVETNLPYREA